MAIREPLGSQQLVITGQFTRADVRALAATPKRQESNPRHTSMYVHTQRNRMLLLFICLAGLIPMGLLLSRSLAPAPFGIRLTVFAALLAMFASALVFTSLTVAVRDGELQWWFGPRVVRKSVPLSSIATVEPTTASLLYGVGIHLTMRGWLYNVQGRRAVLVTLRSGKRFLLGTDEPERLVDAIATTTRQRR